MNEAEVAEYGGQSLVLGCLLDRKRHWGGLPSALHRLQAKHEEVYEMPWPPTVEVFLHQAHAQGRGSQTRILPLWLVETNGLCELPP